jgi:hypothetical protein
VKLGKVRIQRGCPLQDITLAVGGQQNSAGLVEMVEGNERGLMVRNLGRADLARTELLACCG